VAKKSGRKVRVAIIGVGNCASSLVQGVEFYKNTKEGDRVPGLMHVNLGGYHIRDIEFSAAFDVVEGKVGLDLSAAIFAHPNNTLKFTDVPQLNVPVERGMTHDGIGKYLSQMVKKAPGPTADIVHILRETKTDVVVSYLPVGSEMATKWYVEQVLEAGCAFVNCIPVFIASQPYWQKRFAERGLPIIGDDIKRLESKKISKTNAVTSQLDFEIDEQNVHVGPSDYVPWLTDRKWCYIRMEGTTFGNAPLNVELKLEVWDSPNSAGVVIDAVRCAKLALERGLAGPIKGPSSYFMKTPPEQYTDDTARRKTEEFIAGK
jgi:myo-inositol-1-phosphate synthase